MEVEWKKIEGYSYSVSNMGQVRNDEPDGHAIRIDGILSLTQKQNGYYQVQLYQNRKQKYFLVHCLVAMAFILNPKQKPEVNHKNLDKADNRVENLEWVTSKENHDHARKNGVRFGCFQKNHKFGSRLGIEHNMAKLNENQVLEIRRLYNTNNYTQRKLANFFEISFQQISCIVNNKTWKHI